MEETVNWATVGVSWALSTVSMIIILCLASYLKRFCCKSKDKNNPQYAPSKNYPNGIDLMEWCAEKPLQTSSPIPTLKESKRCSMDPKHGIDYNQEKEIVSLLPKSSENITKSKDISTGRPTNYRHTIQATSAEHEYYDEMKLDSNNLKCSKDENILRNAGRRTKDEKSIPPSKPFSNVSNNIWRNAPPNQNPRSKSTQYIHPNKDPQLTTVIKNLKSSPTEKRRQSYERLKYKKGNDPSEPRPIVTTTKSAEMLHTFKIDNSNSSDEKYYGKNSKNVVEKTFKPRTPPPGGLSIEKAIIQLPPRPHKHTTYIANPILKGNSTGHFEIRSGSNSPPPTLMPLTASTSSRRATSGQRNDLTKSLSSETFASIIDSRRKTVGATDQRPSLTQLSNVKKSPLQFSRPISSNSSC